MPTYLTPSRFDIFPANHAKLGIAPVEISCDSVEGEASHWLRMGSQLLMNGLRNISSRTISLNFDTITITHLLASQARQQPLDVVTNCIEEELIFHPKSPALAAFNFISFLAAALEGPLSVGAQLRAGGDPRTFIDILAESEWRERKTLLAFAN